MRARLTQIARIAASIEKLAAELEEQSPIIALALDSVSDLLDRQGSTYHLLTPESRTKGLAVSNRKLVISPKIMEQIKNEKPFKPGETVWEFDGKEFKETKWEEPKGVI